MTAPSSPPQGLVVVADDEPHIVMLVERLLTRVGVQVATARDGDLALELIRQRSPALAIIDARMPGCDGYTVAMALRDDDGVERPPYLIMLTAGGREIDRARAKEAGIDEFVTKPFSPSQLQSRVLEVLEGLHANDLTTDRRRP